MPNPSLIVQMAFGQTWKSAPSSYSWTDVTSYAREVNIRRGSNDPLRSFEAGSATVTLSNPGGIFNPNTEGPYLGYIKPRVPIRIRGTYSTTTRTNLITNPSIETDTTGWAAGSGTTITRYAVSDMIGSYAIRAERATVGTLLIEANPRISVTAATAYSFSLFLSDFNLHSGITVGISWYNSGGSLISTTSQAWPQVYGLKMGRLYATGTAPAGTVTAKPFISFASAEAGIPVYLDGFLFEASSTINPYFDGSIPGCSWTGTAHASTSQQASTTQTLFTGYVQEFPYTFPANGNDAVVTINAVDGLGILGSVDLPDTPVFTSIALGTYATTANTKAYFRLGDTGTVLTDSSDGQQNMAITGTAKAGSAISGLLGSSSLFANDWSASGAFISDKTSFPRYWQTSFWIQTSTAASAGAANVIFDVYSPDSTGGTTYINILSAYIGSDGKLYAVIADQNGIIRRSSTNVALTDDLPHHVTLSYYTNLAGSSPASWIEIYVDGVSAYTVISGINTPCLFYGTLTVGKSQAVNTSAWYNAQLGLNPVGYRGSLQDLAFNYFGVTSVSTAYAAELYGYGSGTLSETSGARIGRVLNIVGWNSTDRDISSTTYTTVNGWTLGGNALAHLRTVTEGEHSKLWFDSAGILTYTDRYAQSTRTRSRELQAFFNNLPLYWGVTRIGYSGLDWTYTAEQTINSFSVSTSDDNPQTDYNQTAIDAYGERSQSLSTFLSSTGQALTLAQMVVYENAYAAIIPSGFQVSPGTYPELEWPSLLRLELMDRVEVCFGDPDEIGPTVPRLDVTSLLQTIEITATPSQWIWNLSTTGRTEPTNYFRLDIDALDDSTKVLGF